MSKSILFVINGFGMGNATRCDSLMDVLAVDASIDVITSDKPYLYFSHNPKVTNLFKQKDLNLEKKFRYGSLKFYFSYIPHFFKRLWGNYQIQKNILSVNRYDYIIFDSDYCFVLHKILGNKKNLIGINNSYEVINYFIKQPASLKLNLILSLFLELSDLVVHYTFCRFVIAPCLDIEVSRNKLISLNKILLSPPLVRWSLMRNLKKNEASLKNVLVTLSSSNVESPISKLKNFKENFTLDNVQHLTDAKIVVCNSGQSTLSECLYLNKKTVVSALPFHAEQYVNLLIVLNKGMLAYDQNTQLDQLAADSSAFDYSYSYEQSIGRIKTHFTHIERELYDNLC